MRFGFREIATVATLAATTGLIAPASAGVITSTFVNGNDILSVMGTQATIGFAYAGDKFIGSVQRDGTNVLFQTNLTGGSVAQFAPTVSLLGTASSEHFVTASLGLGGFPNRDIYVASGSGIVHITHDGTSSDNFVTGLNGTVRGNPFRCSRNIWPPDANHYDVGKYLSGEQRGCSNADRIDRRGRRGLDIAVSGPHSGSLIVASEGSGNIRAIDPTTHAVTIIANVPSAEELTFIPLDLNISDPVEGFYGANYAVDIQKGDASLFTSNLGDIIVTGETTHNVNLLHYNPATMIYETTVLGTFPNQPEDGIFVTSAIVRGADVPEPATLAVFGFGILGAGYLRRRKRVV